MRLLLTLYAVLWAPSAYPAQLAGWEAGNPANQGLTLLSGPDTRWTVERYAGTAVAHIAPTNDYYRRATFLVRVDKTVSGPVWFSVEYLDRGYALIELVPGTTQAYQRGIARLNSGKFRQAVFRFDRPDFGRPIAIRGVEYLRSLALSSTEPPEQPIPEVKPALEFRTHSQRVTTAGADARTPDQLPEALASLRNLLPLARALGFNAIESYVKWDFVERSPGVFDWSYYDAVVNEIERQGLQWFPLLIVGSAYTLPEWYHSTRENVGFECLEHHMRNDIQSIFCDNQVKYVKGFLREFGSHYGKRKTLQGIRLGPSANYGEAQYPARGDWGYKWQSMHTHIGYWAADPYALLSFRAWLKQRYASIADLNGVWGDRFDSFDGIQTFLPITAATSRKRIDFATWYMDSMSEWCEKWAGWAREAMPDTVIHQSSGGWGPVEIGTDYGYQARSMAKLKGGIRLTNESDNFADNFSITRMASSAARFYGAALGYEPGGFGSARGVVARLFNAVTTGAEHLFYYHSNLYGNDQGIDAWLGQAQLLDRRAKPMIDVAAFYPDTQIKLDDEVIRDRWGSVFLTLAQELRSLVDYDYVSEQMIADGALDRYKVLIFLWGHTTEKPILERIARWVEAGGIVIYSERARGPLSTVEGDASVSQRWHDGQTGKGRVLFYPGDIQPGDYYARFILAELRKLSNLRPEIRKALSIEKPPEVYWSVLEGGALALLNFTDSEAEVRLDGGKVLRLKPYTMTIQ